MDRAHRLGQTRTVNVYRLLTRGTLEERIMGLQRFKLDVANAVVNTDNASLASMDTSQILDLFAPPSQPSKRPQPTPAIEANGGAWSLRPEAAQHAHLALCSAGVVVTDSYQLGSGYGVDSGHWTPRSVFIDVPLGMCCSASCLTLLMAV